jgi:hypothetical protein
MRDHRELSRGLRLRLRHPPVRAAAGPEPVPVCGRFRLPPPYRVRGRQLHRRMSRRRGLRPSVRVRGDGRRPSRKVHGPGRHLQLPVIVPVRGGMRKGLVPSVSGTSAMYDAATLRVVHGRWRLPARGSMQRSHPRRAIRTMRLLRAERILGIERSTSNLRKRLRLPRLGSLLSDAVPRWLGMSTRGSGLGPLHRQALRHLGRHQSIGRASEQLHPMQPGLVRPIVLRGNRLPQRCQPRRQPGVRPGLRLLQPACRSRALQFGRRVPAGGGSVEPLHNHPGGRKLLPELPRRSGLRRRVLLRRPVHRRNHLRASSGPNLSRLGVISRTVTAPRGRIRSGSIRPKPSGSPPASALSPTTKSTRAPWASPRDRGPLPKAALGPSRRRLPRPRGRKRHSPWRPPGPSFRRCSWTPTPWAH